MREGSLARSYSYSKEVGCSAQRIVFYNSYFQALLLIAAPAPDRFCLADVYDGKVQQTRKSCFTGRAEEDSLGKQNSVLLLKPPRMLTWQAC